MRRILGLALLAAVAAATCPARPAQAGDWCSDIWASMKRDAKRNNAWPEPFVHYDRRAVYQPFAMMVQKGWSLQNTLGAHHFDPKTSTLTEAGALRVQWIMTQAPLQFRTIYVESANTAVESESRLTSVRGTAQRFVPQGMPVQVMVTNTRVTGWSAEEINSTRVMFQSTAPPPRLPQTGGDGQ
ncbi:MAG: hypothetical protein MPJ50_05855 [Pirellulales bacterium]|nr:hypothetical protein [Pirellulales bacterium]